MGRIIVEAMLLSKIVVASNSGGIPEYLKNGYNGPCPPSGRHSYQFTVHAIDKEGIIIGIGKALKKFP